MRHRSVSLRGSVCVAFRSMFTFAVCLPPLYGPGSHDSSVSVPLRWPHGPSTAEPGWEALVWLQILLPFFLVALPGQICEGPSGGGKVGILPNSLYLLMRWAKRTSPSRKQF